MRKVKQVYRNLVSRLAGFLAWLTHTTIGMRTAARRKYLLLTVVAVLAVALAIAFFKHRQAPSESPTQAKVVIAKNGLTKKAGTGASEQEMNVVKVVRVQPETFKDTLEIMGTVKGSTENELRFERSGILNSFNFHEGEHVSKGEVIASLESYDDMLKLRHAKSKLSATENQYMALEKRLQVYAKLYKIGGIVKSKLEEMELEGKRLKDEMEVSRTEVAMAQSLLDKTLLVAPTNGVLASRNTEIGEFVDPSVVVATLIGSEEVLIEVSIIEKDIERVKIGQSARVLVDAYPKKYFLGQVSSVSPVVEGKSRTVMVKIKVPNPEGLLLSGMFARGEISIKEIDNAVMLPQDSVLDLGAMKVVPIVVPMEGKEDMGRVEIRKVATGYSVENKVHIMSGIAAGDLVIKETRVPLRDGLEVKIVYE